MVTKSNHVSNVTLNYSQFSAAATTATVDVFYASDGDYILAFGLVVPVVAFAGGAVSAATVSLGLSTALTGLVAAKNVFTGASLGRANATTAANLGTSPIYVPKGGKVQAQLTTTTANTNALTAGQVQISIGLVQRLAPAQV